MSKVAVIGVGRVGAPLVGLLQAAGHEVYVHDSDVQVLAEVVNGRLPFKHHEVLRFPLQPCEAWTGQNVNFAIIVVPTPSSNEGSFDASHVHAAYRIARPHAETVICVSTVSPGTDMKDMVYMPVMIQLGNVQQSMMDQAYFIVGCQDELVRMKVKRFVYTFMQEDACYIPDLFVAEAIAVKLLVNFYLAMKISFANAVAAQCRQQALNFERVLDCIGHDPRVGMRYLKGGQPYGGPCLPRDVRAVESWSPQLYEFCEMIHRVNVRVLAEIGETILHAGYKRVYITSTEYRPGVDIGHASFGSLLKELLIGEEIEVVLYPHQSQCIVMTAENDDWEELRQYGLPIINPFAGCGYFGPSGK